VNGSSDLQWSTSPSEERNRSNEDDDTDNDNDDDDDKVKNLIEMWPKFAGETALRQVQFLAAKVSESTDAADESQYSLKTRLQRTGVTTVPISVKDGTGTGTSSNTILKQKQKRRLKSMFQFQRQQPASKRFKKQDVMAGAGGEGGGVFNNAEYNVLARQQQDDWDSGESDGDSSNDNDSGTTSSTGRRTTRTTSSSSSNGSSSSITRPGLQVSSSSKRQEQVWTALANLEIDSKFGSVLCSTGFVLLHFVLLEKSDHDSRQSPYIFALSASFFPPKINLGSTATTTTTTTTKKS
jgi:hypothetical protein